MALIFIKEKYESNTKKMIKIYSIHQVKYHMKI